MSELQRRTAVLGTIMLALGYTIYMAGTIASDTEAHVRMYNSARHPFMIVRDLAYEVETDIPKESHEEVIADTELVSVETTEEYPEWESESAIPETYAETDIPETIEEPTDEPQLMDAEYFKYAGILYDGDTKYTWYSQNVLPGEGLDIPGRHTDMGFVMDDQDRVVVASTDYPPGTEIDIPFGYGKGIVLDTGYLDPGQIDVYTDF